jgi:ribosomal protein S18 acetylase RimI-like enzyme
MSVTVRRASAGDREIISTTLAKAFADDPVKLFLCGGERKPIERSRLFFDAVQAIQGQHGIVDVADNGHAAAIWAPPGHWKVPLSQIARNAHRFVRVYGRRLLPNLGVLNDMERNHPEEPHYYLELLGTDPAHQGKGLGSALMMPMIEQADVEGVGMYLESSKESNVPFYARFGFEVRKELRHRRNGPSMWLMWRDPVAG